MSNNQESFSNSAKKVDVTNCKAKVVGKSNLVACFTEVKACGCRYPVGTNVFCAHPLNTMIAQFALAVS